MILLVVLVENKMEKKREKLIIPPLKYVMKANIVAYATTYSQFRQLRMHKNGYVIRIVNKIMDVNYYVLQEKITFIFFSCHLKRTIIVFLFLDVLD